MSRGPGAGDLLVVDGLAVDYGRVRALRDASLRLVEGETALVLGPNGAGKTSLVAARAGGVAPRARVVEIAGRVMGRLRAERRVRLGVGLVPEGRGTLPGLTVADNLDLGWHAGGGGSRAERRREEERVLELFPILGERMGQDCGTLSGGEMQMLAIARALLARPRLLLLDEPSLGLAPRAVATVHGTLRRLSEEGLTMVLVEQKALTIEWTPDRALVLRNGEVVFEAADRRPTDRELAALYLGDLAGVGS
jgi:branched-chain amino acid transport system ATP-binding protein